MPNNSGAIDLGAVTQPTEEPVAEEQQNEGPTQVLTAFVVIVSPDGNPKIATINDPSLELMVPPTPDLIYGVASTLLKDISSQELVEVIVPSTAQTTINALQQQAQQAYAQQSAKQQLSQLGDLKGGIRG